MMKGRIKYLAFSTLASAAAVAVLVTTPAQSQLNLKDSVALQAANPGYSQSGNANISGTMRAGNFSGNGAGLHSLSGSSISSGVIGGAFLPSAVAMENEGNIFSQTNTFNGVSQFSGTAQFNGAARFMGFTGVGRTSGALGATESFGIGESATGYDGMYIKTSTSGRPFYGYNTGNHTAWHDLQGSTGNWSLTVDNSAVMSANSLGVGIGSTPPGFSGTVLKIGGVTDISGNNGSPYGVVNVYNLGASNGAGINSIAYGGGAGVLARSGGNTLGNGLYADHTGSGDGIAAFCYGWGSTSTGLIGTGGSLGVVGKTNNGSGIGVRGESGSYWGVHGISTASHGVVGQSTQVEGVVGLTSAVGRHAVHGWTDTVSANGGYFTTAANSGTGNGVVGHTLSATGFGVQSVGRFTASGTKSFRIDHPLDPENKFLTHYCAEGPEPLNVYSGKITTGADGYAWIELPEYFGEINRDPRVQLTVSDNTEDFVMSKVVGDVTRDGFRIRTSKPNVKVYWEVKAVRNDRFVQTYGAPVESTKTDMERGRYLHPELYGEPHSKSMFITAGREMMESRIPTPETPKKMPLTRRPESQQTYVGRTGGK